MTNNLQYSTPELRKKEIHEKFTEDMEKAGYYVEFYKGRNFYEGPAVKTNQGIDGLQKAIRATKQIVVWDQLGSDYVLYPR